MPAYFSVTGSTVVLYYPAEEIDRGRAAGVRQDGRVMFYRRPGGFFRSSPPDALVGIRPPAAHYRPAARNESRPLVRGESNTNRVAKQHGWGGWGWGHGQ